MSVSRFYSLAESSLSINMNVSKFFRLVIINKYKYMKVLQTVRIKCLGTEPFDPSCTLTIRPVFSGFGASYQVNPGQQTTGRKFPTCTKFCSASAIIFTPSEEIRSCDATIIPTEPGRLWAIKLGQQTAGRKFPNQCDWFHDPVGTISCDAPDQIVRFTGERWHHLTPSQSFSPHTSEYFRPYDVTVLWHDRPKRAVYRLMPTNLTQDSNWQKIFHTIGDCDRFQSFGVIQVMRLYDSTTKVIYGPTSGGKKNRQTATDSVCAEVTGVAARSCDIPLGEMGGGMGRIGVMGREEGSVCWRKCGVSLEVEKGGRQQWLPVSRQHRQAAFSYNPRLDPAPPSPSCRSRQCWGACVPPLIRLLLSPPDGIPAGGSHSQLLWALFCLKGSKSSSPVLLPPPHHTS